MTLTAVTKRVHETFSPVAKRLLNPATLAGIATKLPHQINASVIELMCNKAFSEQIEEGDFDFLTGRRLQVEILDAKLNVGLSFNSGKMKCFHFRQEPCSADVTLSIKSADAVSLLQQEIDPDTLFFQRKLKINGDTELAHHVKNTIDTLDPEVIPGFVLKTISEYNRRILNNE